MTAPHRSAALGLLLSGLLLSPVAMAREADDDSESPEATEESDAAAEEEDPEAEDQEPEAEAESEAEGETAADGGTEAAKRDEGERAVEAAPEGDAADEPAAADEQLTKLSLYLEPGFVLRYWPAALPVDRLNHSFFGSAGLTVEGSPFEMWSGKLQVVFSSAAFSAITDAQLVDLGGDGDLDGLVLWKDAMPGVIIEEATVSFDPAEWFGATAGAMRIPFMLQQMSANETLTFPQRSLTSRVFTSGADFGLLLRSNVGDGHFRPSIGIFNGDSLGLTVTNINAQGPVLTARADVNPFGGFSTDEGDVKRGPFRLGIGGALLYRPATLYDTTSGYEAGSIHDLRFSASLRMAVEGLYAAVEYVRRQQDDDFSSRPQVADGGYVQLSYFWQIVDSFALEPIGRVGFVAWDETFDPRLKGTIEGGLNFYPRADAEHPDAIKLTAGYFGERRFTQDEDVHAVQIAARLKF